MELNQILELANREWAEADKSLKSMGLIDDADKLNWEIAYLSLQVATLTKVIAELACPMVEAIIDIGISTTQTGFVYSDTNIEQQTEQQTQTQTEQEIARDLQGRAPRD
jgi:hypothetical protein